MTSLTIARLTFHEAVRRRVVWVALAISGAYLILFVLAAHFTATSGVNGTAMSNALVAREGTSAFLMLGLYGLNFLMSAMIVLASIDSISGEIASNGIHAIATKPIRRWEILVGRWLGFAGMLIAYVVIMAGSVVLLVYAVTGYAPPNPAQGVAMMMIEGFVLLTVSLLGGTLLSTLANGVLVLGLYGLAFAGGWTEQIGSFVHSEAAVNIGIISSLIMPSEALWKRAAYLMQSPLSREFGFSPFATGAAPSVWMVVYAGIYLCVCFLLALRAFARRDL